MAHDLVRTLIKLAVQHLGQRLNLQEWGWAPMRHNNKRTLTVSCIIKSSVKYTDNKNPLFCKKCGQVLQSGHSLTGSPLNPGCPGMPGDPGGPKQGPLLVCQNRLNRHRVLHYVDIRTVKQAMLRMMKEDVFKDNVQTALGTLTGLCGSSSCSLSRH